MGGQRIEVLTQLIQDFVKDTGEGWTSPDQGVT